MLLGWGTEHLPLSGGTELPQTELGKEHWVWRQIKATSVLSTLRGGGGGEESWSSDFGVAGVTLWVTRALGLSTLQQGRKPALESDSWMFSFHRMWFSVVLVVLDEWLDTMI